MSQGVDTIIPDPKRSYVSFPSLKPLRQQLSPGLWESGMKLTTISWSADCWSFSKAALAVSSMLFQVCTGLTSY